MVEPEARERSWWSRNWIWVVPTGCVGVLLIPVACVAGLGLLLYGTIASSDVFTQSMQAAQSHPAIIEALGEPIEHGWVFQGNINVSGSGGDADYSISGPKGTGTLHVVASKNEGEWEFEVLEVELEDGRRIDLLEETLQARCFSF